MTAGLEHRCAHCGHVTRTYRRRFPKADLDTLVMLYAKTLSGAEWVHISKIKRHTSGCGFAKFRYWGFVETRETESDTKDSGFWRLTEQGRRFMAGTERAWSHIILEDATFKGFSGKLVNVKEAYAMAGFSYAELMQPFDIRGSAWRHRTTDKGGCCERKPFRCRDR